MKTRSLQVAVILAVMLVSVQSMYTQGYNVPQQNGGSPFSMYLQQLQYQRMYQQPQRPQYNNGMFNIPPWAFMMDGFDFGF